ncbi:MAG: signal peptidase I [Candidatus Nanoarchaeia archaeon]|nr:signal peptidase I [Candidatus Nanoarchaeia archaeon]
MNSIKKAWNFIWHGKGWKSWLAFLVFALVFVNIAYPLFIQFLGLFGVADLFAVVSESMVHNKDSITSYSIWLENNNLNSTSWDFQNGLYPGEVAVIMKVDPEEIYIGDVIVFRTETGIPIIHRVIMVNYEEDKYYFTTKGDANAGILSFEYKIPEERLVGKASFSIPFIGVPKYILTVVVGWFTHGILL